MQLLDFTPDRQLTEPEQIIHCSLCGVENSVFYTHYIPELDIWLCQDCNDTHHVCPICNNELTEADVCEYCAQVEE